MARRAGRQAATRVMSRPPVIERIAEMGAIFMIGDGLLGVLQPRRHVAVWRDRALGAEVLVQPFDGHPGRRRLYGLVQIGVGLALATRLKAPDR